MIKSLSAPGPFLTIMGGMPGSNYVNNYSGAQGVGNMRFNTTTQNIEIYDGTNWITLQSSHAGIQLTDEAIQILNWAKTAMLEELRINELAKKHPAIDAALENVRRAEEQLKVTVILAEERPETTQYHPV